MVILGVDAHKRTHTFVVVDEVGRKLAERTVAATDEGHVEALAWARGWDDRRFALEDCRPVTRRLEAHLLADHREDLVAERTRIQSRVRWHLHEVFHGLEIEQANVRLHRIIAALAA